MKLTTLKFFVSDYQKNIFNVFYAKDLKNVSNQMINDFNLSFNVVYLP